MMRLPARLQTSYTMAVTEGRAEGSLPRPRQRYAVVRARRPIEARSAIVRSSFARADMARSYEGAGGGATWGGGYVA